MNQKLNQTASTIQYQTDSSRNSIFQSRVQFKQSNEKITLSNSLAFLTNPFSDNSRVKFSKNRFRKGCESHILQQTKQAIIKSQIKTFQLSNQQFLQKTPKRLRNSGLYHKNALPTGDFISHSLEQRGISLQSTSKRKRQLFFSPQKTEKRHFHNLNARQVEKNPIILGQQTRLILNSNYQQRKQSARIQRYYGEGFKDNLIWKQHNSLSKGKLQTIFQNLKTQRMNQTCQPIMVKQSNKCYKKLQDQKQTKFNTKKNYKDMYYASKKK